MPLSLLRGLTPRFLKLLQKLGIETARDLLWHFPARYEDFSQIYKIAELEPGQHATVRGVIENVKSRRTWQRHIALVEAEISDDSGTIRAVWFNQPYLASALRPGRIANFAGKVSMSDEGELYLSHPAYELIGNQKSDIRSQTMHTARLVPIYPETYGLTSRGLRFLIQPILKSVERFPEWIPGEILKENDLPEINRALYSIHFPQNIEDAATAKKRFVFEDLFLLQLYNLEQKLKLAEETAPAVKTDIERLKNLIAELPFELTQSQKKSLWEIIQDLEKPRPMNRLLQGDVGSGKTVVAALAAIIAAENGYQTAFMAPTEILARQHFETLKKLFLKITKGDQPALGLITSGSAKIIHADDMEAAATKPNLIKKLADGEVKIAIGTHALIQKSIAFKNLGLVVVDEQHRFGVRQRAALLRDTKNTLPSADGFSGRLMPHFLSMSATPIPRTLMLTIFGDLDVSLITELPAGRKNIATKIVPPTGRKETYGFIRQEVKSGRQAFVICPRIEPAQNNAEQTRSGAEATFPHRSASVPRNSASLWETKAVKEEYEKLSKKIFPDLRVAMLHGQLKPKEKEKIMREFHEGRTDILVSTSVIEVGIDMPNATIMMIEGADKFGLAQLYQFRGRVGRGEHQSYCFLLTDSSSQSTAARLKAITEAKNGFELAEMDLKIRGPGEFLGEAQTGLPDFAMSALRDAQLVKTSRESAAGLLQADPKLKKYPLLREKLSAFQKKIHPE